MKDKEVLLLVLARGRLQRPSSGVTTVMNLNPSHGEMSLHSDLSLSSFGTNLMLYPWKITV